MHLFLILPLILLLAADASASHARPMRFVPLIPQTAKASQSHRDRWNDAAFAGRLYVEDVGINVALYRSNSQAVVDREDSAAYFDLSYARGAMIIADHRTEAFATLSSVREGTIARLELADGTTEYYACTAIFRGHNTGKGITDWEGVSVVGQAELMMYTCFDGWQNVWVVLWESTPNPDEERSQRILQHVIHSIQHLMDHLQPSVHSPLPDQDSNETELFLD